MSQLIATPFDSRRYSRWSTSVEFALKSIIAFLIPFRALVSAVIPIRISGSVMRRCQVGSKVKTFLIDITRVQLFVFSSGSITRLISVQPPQMLIGFTHIGRSNYLKPQFSALNFHTLFSFRRSIV